MMLEANICLWLQFNLNEYMILLSLLGEAAH